MKDKDTHRRLQEDDTVRTRYPTRTYLLAPDSYRSLLGLVQDTVFDCKLTVTTQLQYCQSHYSTVFIKYAYNYLGRNEIGYFLLWPPCL